MSGYQVWLFLSQTLSHITNRRLGISQLRLWQTEKQTLECCQSLAEDKAAQQVTWISPANRELSIQFSSERGSSLARISLYNRHGFSIVSRLKAFWDGWLLFTNWPLIVSYSISFQKGDILIVRTTDVGWSPYFPLISGLVTEIGGLISHGATVAREFGLPCIVGAKRATQVFKSGIGYALRSQFIKVT